MNQKNALFGAASSTPSSSSANETGKKKEGAVVNNSSSGGKTSFLLSSSTPSTSTASNTKANDTVIKKKIEEAKSFSSQGAAHLQTSLFKWAPDFLLAASYFERAADAYFSAHDLNNAKLMRIAAAEANISSKAYAAGAMDYFQAAKLAHDAEAVKEAAKLYLKAAEAWGLHGDMEKTSDSFLKAAMEIEDVNFTKSLEFYHKAVNLLFPDELRLADIARLPPSILQTCRELFSVLLRRELYAEALLFAEQKLFLLFSAFELESSLFKNMCGISILTLVTNDVIHLYYLNASNHDFKSETGGCREGA